MLHGRVAYESRFEKEDEASRHIVGVAHTLANRTVTKHFADVAKRLAEGSDLSTTGVSFAGVRVNPRHLQQLRHGLVATVVHSQRKSGTPVFVHFVDIDTGRLQEEREAFALVITVVDRRNHQRRSTQLVGLVYVDARRLHDQGESPMVAFVPERVN